MVSAALRNSMIAATISILALMATLGTTAPALAHESISDQYPASGQTISAGATTLRLLFTGDLLVLADASGIEMEITEPSGQSIKLAELGCLVIGARSIEARVELEHTGEYLVTWQVTAGDGHPLSESFTFQLENESGFVASTPLNQIECAGNRLPDGTVVGPKSNSTEAPAAVSTNTWLAILLSLALALIALLTYLLLKPGHSRANRN